MAEIEKHRGSKAVGVCRGYRSASRTLHEDLDRIRVSANPTTLLPAIEAQQKIDAFAAEQVQRVRAAGRV